MRPRHRIRSQTPRDAHAVRDLLTLAFPTDAEARLVETLAAAKHLCMAMRGVEKQNSFALTSAMRGSFRENVRTRMEFLELLKLRGDMRSALDPARVAEAHDEVAST